jgi:hypothetical protein
MIEFIKKLFGAKPAAAPVVDAKVEAANSAPYKVPEPVTPAPLVPEVKPVVAVEPVAEVKPVKAAAPKKPAPKKPAAKIAPAPKKEGAKKPGRGRKPNAK